MTGLLKWFQGTDRLLVLRGAAALSVIAYHTQDAYRTIFKPLHVLGHDVSWLFLANGGMAVRVFFTLSGFLMFKAFYTKRYSIDRPGITAFFRSRAKRIAPLYYFLVLVFVAVVYPGLLSLRNLSVLANLLTFTYSGAAPPIFANAFWSLSTEVEFYILVPFLVLLGFRLIKKRWHTVVAAGLVVILGLALRWVLRGAPLSAAVNLLTNIDTFLLGGLVCVWLYGFEDSRQAKISPAICLGVGLVLFPILSLYEFKHPQYGYLVAAPTIAAGLTALYIWSSEKIASHEFVKTTYRLRDVYRRPPLWPAYIGAISYGIYLWHMPIAAQIQGAGILPKTGWKTFAVEYALIVVIAVICAASTHRYIERAQAR